MSDDIAPALTEDASLVGFIRYITTEKRLSPHTVAAYQRDLAALRAFCVSAEVADWKSVSSHHLRQFAAASHRGGLDGRSVARYLSAARSFFRYLVREGVVNVNPVEGVAAPKAAKRLPAAVDVDQVAALLTINPGADPLAVRDVAIMELFYSSGLRLAELLGLDLPDLDLTGATVRVTGKGSRTRVVPVGAKAVVALHNWLNARALWVADASSALFVTAQGRRVSPRAVQARLKGWGTKQGLEGRLHPHRLRHSFASHLLESSGDIRAVQELLGHANISTTQVYTHLDFQHLAQVYDAAHPRARKKKSE